MEIKFEHFTILVDHIVELKPFEKGTIYITEFRIEDSEFKDFLDFYHTKNKKGNYFHAIIHNKPFFGRFLIMKYTPGEGDYKVDLFFQGAITDAIEDELQSGNRSAAVKTNPFSGSEWVFRPFVK